MWPWKKKKDTKVEKGDPVVSASTISSSNSFGTFTVGPSTMVGGAAGTAGTIISTVATTGFNYANLTTSAPTPTPTPILNAGANYMAGTGFATGNFTIGQYQPSNIISIQNQGKEIVRLNLDGSVTWNDEINVDEAAEAFARSMRIGLEIQAGITKGVKSRMRDAVFEEIIELAKINGKLTLDELTFMYESSKIMEKLKGGRD